VVKEAAVDDDEDDAGEKEEEDWAAIAVIEQENAECYWVQQSLKVLR
jgi:hypothetical protein